MPTFGRDTIRRFRKNVSETKQFAARDYEDVLQVGTLCNFLSLRLKRPVRQCSIPVFAGLLPEPQNTQVTQLLFVLCHWHGLAKLRLHTDETLHALDMVTKDLGDRIRNFASDTCRTFATKELPRETASRHRRQAQQKQSKSSKVQGTTSHVQARQPKTFNLQTYKLHALADYPSQIRMYGTTDSYSTQSVRVALSWSSGL